MSETPDRASAVIIGAGIVGNSLAYHLARLGWTAARAGGQGPDAEPRRLDRARLELHLPDRVLQDDDGAHQGQHRAVQGARRLHRERRDRGRPDAGADAGAAPPVHAGEVLGHPGRAADAGGRAQAGALPRRLGDPRRRVLPDRRRRRLAARGHADARAGAAAGRADGASPAPRCSASTSPRTAGSPACAPARATSRPMWSRSAAACGARGSRGWLARASRSPRSCTR